MKHGADPNIGPTPGGIGDNDYHASPYEKSGEALNAAAESGSLAVFNMLIEYGAKIEYSSALQRAAYSLKEESERILIMERILQLGVDINSRDTLEAHHGHGTALHHAIRGGHAERVKFLIDHGANPYVRDGISGNNAIEEATKWGKNILEMLGR